MTPGQEQQAEAPQQTPEQKQFADNLKQVEAAVKAPEQAEQIKKLLDRNFQEWLKNLANTSEGQKYIKDIYTQIENILIPNSESSTRLHDANEAVLKNLQILIAPFTMESKFANVNIAIDASMIKTGGNTKETYNENIWIWLLRASISKLGSNVYQNLPARDTILKALQNPTKENIQSLQIFLASNLKNGKDKDDFLKWNNKKEQSDTRDGKYGKLTDGALNAYIDQSKTQMEANAVTKNTADESIAELQKITKERPIPQMAAVAAPALRKTVSPAEQQQKQIDNLKILQKSELFAKLPNKLHNKIDSVLKKDDGQQDGEYSVKINDRINDITALIDEEIAEKKKAREGYLPEGEFQKYGNDITALIAAKSGTINQKDTTATVIDTPVATFSQEPDAVKPTESAPINQNLNFSTYEEVKPTPQQTEATPITLTTEISKVDAGKVFVDKANTKVDNITTTHTTDAGKIKPAEIINTTLNNKIVASVDKNWLVTTELTFLDNQKYIDYSALQTILTNLWNGLEYWINDLWQLVQGKQVKDQSSFPAGFYVKDWILHKSHIEGNLIKDVGYDVQTKLWTITPTSRLNIPTIVLNTPTIAVAESTWIQWYKKIIPPIKT